MLVRIRTRILLATVMVVACDTPTQPELSFSPAYLVGNKIKTRYPSDAWNLDQVLQRATKSTVVSEPLLSLTVKNEGTWVKCNQGGTGSLSTTFKDEALPPATYEVICRPVVTLEFSVGKPINLDARLRADEGRDLERVIQPDGLIRSETLNGDVFVTCVTDGRGTLWGFFSRWTDETKQDYYDELFDYYDLRCVRENFPITPGVGILVDVGAYFRELDGRTVTTLAVTPAGLGGQAQFGAASLVPSSLEDSLPAAANGGFSVGLLCYKAGKGVLKVYFAPNGVSVVDEYALTCKGHDQGGGG